MGAGVSGGLNRVHTFTVAGDILYAGGDYERMDGMVAASIATWNTRARRWSVLRSTDGGIGVGGDVWAVAVRGSDVYIGGHVTSDGNVGVNYVVKFDGAQWTALGSGVNDDQFWVDTLALAVDAGHVYAGGTFTTAGDKPSFFFGVWSEPSRTFLPVIGRAR